MSSATALPSVLEKGSEWQQGEGNAERWTQMAAGELKALNVFEAMLKAKVVPDVISYSAAISACEKGGEWQKALKLFEAMLKATVAPNVFSYNATISACEKGGQWQQALNSFEEMPKATVAPDVISYSATISACEKGGQWQQALNFFEAMPRAKLLPNIVTYNALLDCREIGSSKSLGGHIFQHGLLKILQGTSVFQDLKVDLHDHSEGAARLTLQWWLSTAVAKRLEVSDRLNCIVVTGYGKSRQAWDRTNVQAVVLDLLKGLKLDAQVLRENLVTSKDLSCFFVFTVVYFVYFVFLVGAVADFKYRYIMLML